MMPSCPPSGRFAARRAASLLAAAGLVLVFAAGLRAVTGVSRADADAMLRKIAVIAVNGLSARPASARQTPITESELNSFLNIHARKDIPAGVVDPVVVIDAAGRLTGRAIVDLDQVRDAQQAGGSSVLSLLSGRVPVEARGILHTGDGKGRFELESASAGGVPVPPALLQEIVRYYSRSEANPAGIDLGAPFELPVGIREIQTLKGQAIVVQ